MWKQTNLTTRPGYNKQLLYQHQSKRWNQHTSFYTVFEQTYGTGIWWRSRQLYLSRNGRWKVWLLPPSPLGSILSSFIINMCCLGYVVWLKYMIALLDYIAIYRVQRYWKYANKWFFSPAKHIIQLAFISCLIELS